VIRKTTQLKRLLDSDRLEFLMEAHSGLSAKIVEEAGFAGIWGSGLSISAAFGVRDCNELSWTQVLDAVAFMSDATSIPILLDADTGYGNELNVVRTVQEYERAGVSAIHLEDQEFPKKCGHLDDKKVIPLDDFLAKIRAAADARADADFQIIARTDSRAVIDFDEAIKRVNAALEAGTDIAFVEAPQTLDEVKAVPKLVNGPCLLNVVHRGKTPDVDLGDAQAMGYKLAILPTLLFRSVLGLCVDLLSELKETNKFPTPPGDLSPQDAFRLFGADEWDELRGKYTKAPSASKAAAE